MRRAIALARKGQGSTRPNPCVGAVVVREGQEVGSGFHKKAGGPHAEVFALNAAGPLAEGATLYVTLEPCSTQGRTPPCTNAIRSHRVKRVVVGVVDPNPRHSGAGVSLLRRAKIQVTTGTLADECGRLLAPFTKWIVTQRPYVTLKLGISTDGRIADTTGRSQWITGETSRRAVHALRERVDAVMVGSGTVLADDPSLLPTVKRAVTPFRIVVDSRGRLPLTARILTDGHTDRTVIATSPRCSTARRKAYESVGATVWILPEKNGHVSMLALMKKVGQEGLLHILCEGGGALAGALVEARLVDEYLFFVAPMLIGGAGRPAVMGAWPLARAPQLAFEEMTRSGPDLLIRARPAG
jgi:diaminohydroxyphosphoribosylaminopyrimidine deaminase/5-amino-6-(5-phosphoribosylamino)uracil reductase